MIKRGRKNLVVYYPIRHEKIIKEFEKNWEIKERLHLIFNILPIL